MKALAITLLFTCTAPALANGGFGPPPGADPRTYCASLGAMYEAIGFHRNSGISPAEAGRNLGAYRQIEPMRQVHAVNEVYFSPRFASPELSGLGEQVTARCLEDAGALRQRR